jgi:hypothetical protein
MNEIAGIREVRDEWCAEYVKLRDKAAKAVRILSEIEFDGQAYDAVKEVIKLLSIARRAA